MVYTLGMKDKKNNLKGVDTMIDLRIKTIGKVKQGFFRLELQGLIKNTALHILDSALSTTAKPQAVKVNINQYTIKAV